MKLLRINKYILGSIFTHLKFTKELNIIRYNKKLQSKIDLSLYTYQKKYLESIISPALLNNLEILLKNNIYDKKTLNKLIFDWENETTEIIREKDCFHFKSFPNLIELNLSNSKNLELPCSLLLYLETLSIKNISKLKFLNKEKNISLNNLSHLYLDNISFDKENEIKISLNNLKYLDIRLKEQEGDQKEAQFDNDNNRAGFIKEKTLEYLINIFNFNFLSVFKIEDEEDEEVAFNKILEYEETFKKPKELFDKKYLNKYDYFNLEILYEYFFISGAADFAERFIYKYFFAKTKRNKYIFKTEYTNFDDSNGSYSEIFNKEIRYCNNIDYNNYYFNNNELEIGGDVGNYTLNKLDYDTINNFSIATKYDTYFYSLVNSLDYFEKNNKLEILSIEDLDLSYANSFWKNLKKFNNLKSFYITQDFKYKNNKEIIDLLTALSKIKTIFLINIKIKSELKLNNNEEKKINKILPDIAIKAAKNESSIKWYNNNYTPKILRKVSQI